MTPLTVLSVQYLKRGSHWSFKLHLFLLNNSLSVAYIIVQIMVQITVLKRNELQRNAAYKKF